ncbi:MAG: four helix bundle protein [Patescibacteria group bacterium]
MNNSEKSRQLEQRTFKFGADTIKLCRRLGPDNISAPIINQLIRSGTSIGANYLEANNASSKKDFTNKIFICKKESEETKYWLKLLLSCYSPEKESVDVLYDECRQLNLIFQKIVTTIRNGK